MNDHLQRGELTIFIGYSQDAKVEAQLIYDMRAEFQTRMKNRLSAHPNPPFNSVNAWKWDSDAAGRSGGQDVLVTPHLAAAHFAVFVFKERVGVETWNELSKCRELTDNRPAIAAVFPAQLPHPDRMNELDVAKSWAELQERKRELTADWSGPESTAIRPLDGYRNNEHLKQILLEQFERDLGAIIQRETSSGKAPLAAADIAGSRLIYEPSEQIAFDRRVMNNHPLLSLEQTVVSKLVDQPQPQRELQEAGLVRASLVQKTDYLGLTSKGRVTMGLFLCCAPREDLVDKFSSCSLKTVVYSEVDKSIAKPRMEDRTGNLLWLFDQGMTFFGRDADLSRIGTIGSNNRDELEIPTNALREALVNALIHRDYESPAARGQPTRIEVYPDRIEISSFGGLMKGVSLKAMNDDAKKLYPVRRNEIITKIFSWSQHAELNASGIARMQSLANDQKLPKPLIELSDDDYVVKITLYRPLRDRSKFDQIVAAPPKSGPQRDTRPTVYISSTASDLAQHREQVGLACQRAGFTVRTIEHVPSNDADVVSASLTIVAQTDVYLCILGYRYGYVPEGHEISITEIEYNRATDLRKPSIIFLMDKDHPVTVQDIEDGPGAVKLKALKDRIGQSHIARVFKSAGDLRAQVIEALGNLRNDLQTAGPDSDAAESVPRKSTIPSPPDPYIAHPYALLQSRDLIGRQAELDALTEWVTKPSLAIYDIRIICLIALGGTGKSALAWKWFNQIAPSEMEPLAGRMWWSFYEDDTTFENFLNRALCYVSGQNEEAIAALSWRDREAQLLQYLNEKPYLFVLDGLERALVAYDKRDASTLADDPYDERTSALVVGGIGLRSSAANAFVGQHRLRQTKDPRAGPFLRRLAQIAKSRILITSRLYPYELQMPTGSPRPGSTVLILDGLSEADALDLWRALGVSGTNEEIAPILRSVENHPLLMQLIASEVANYRKAPGNFSQWRADHPQFDPVSLPLIQSRTHILAVALEGLSAKARSALSMVVGLRKAANHATLEALLVGPDKTCNSSQELDLALTELEDRGLIGWDRRSNQYDAHPIVRAVVWQLTNTQDRRAIDDALSVLSSESGHMPEVEVGPEDKYLVGPDKPD